MEESSLLKIISEKFVKPSSSTPPSSRYYKFSAFDVYVGHSFTPMAFFYPKGSFHGGQESSLLKPRTEIFELLETSLSKALTYYYPFAGRFMDDNLTVDCNDDGVKVWEVQVQASMSEILNNREGYHPWTRVFLQEMCHSEFSHVMVQLSYFECGGVCVGISMSHKLGDAATLANFLNDWAVMTRASHEAIPPMLPPPPPVLSSASIFPPPNCPINISPTVERSCNLVTQRFVFSASSISELKKKMTAEAEIKNPTQTEVVTALIFKAVMSAAAKMNSGIFKPSSLAQVANFRSLTIPPLSEKQVGNLINRFLTIVREDKDRELIRIVTELRKSKVEYMETHKARLEGNEFVDRYHRLFAEDEKKLKDDGTGNNSFDKYTFTSCIRIPFYEADFGFGKPVFVCSQGGLNGRTILMLANPNGNEIDAFVTLKQEQLFILEKDEELLSFASLNPIISASN